MGTRDIDVGDEDGSVFSVEPCCRPSINARPLHRIESTDTDDEVEMFRGSSSGIRPNIQRYSTCESSDNDSHYSVEMFDSESQYHEEESGFASDGNRDDTNEDKNGYDEAWDNEGMSVDQALVQHNARKGDAFRMACFNRGLAGKNRRGRHMRLCRCAVLVVLAVVSCSMAVVGYMLLKKDMDYHTDHSDESSGGNNISQFSHVPPKPPAQPVQVHIDHVDPAAEYIKEICSPGAIDSEEGFAKCEETCAPANCCWIPEDDDAVVHPSCYDENKDACHTFDPCHLLRRGRPGGDNYFKHHTGDDVSSHNDVDNDVSPGLMTNNTDLVLGDDGLNSTAAPKPDSLAEGDEEGNSTDVDFTISVYNGTDATTVGSDLMSNNETLEEGSSNETLAEGSSNVTMAVNVTENVVSNLTDVDDAAVPPAPQYETTTEPPRTTLVNSEATDPVNMNSMDVQPRSAGSGQVQYVPVPPTRTRHHKNLRPYKPPTRS